MNDKHYGSFADGYGRISRFDIKDGKVSFKSRMMETKYYNQSKKENTIIPGTLFTHTKPERARSKIPGMNVYYSSKYGDNQWVDMERMADGKTFVTTTDTFNKLVMDLDTLKPSSFVGFTDKVSCLLGVTHSQTLPDGSILSICPSKGPKMMDNYISVFKMSPDDPFNRVEIAQVKTDYLVYQHGFALSEDYLILFQNPISFDVTGMLAGKEMVDCMLMNKDKTSKIHAVKLSDGSYTTFDTKAWSTTLHFSNAYQPDENTIVFNAPGYFDSSKN